MLHLLFGLTPAYRDEKIHQRNFRVVQQCFMLGEVGYSYVWGCSLS